MTTRISLSGYLSTSSTRAFAASRLELSRLRVLRANARLGPVEQSIVRDLHRMLATSPRGRVAVVSEGWPAGAAGSLAWAVTAGMPRAAVYVVPLDDESDRHARLAADGPFRAIAVGVAAARRCPNLAALYRALLYHLEPGGRLFIANFHPEQPAPSGIWPMLARLVALRGAPVSEAADTDGTDGTDDTDDAMLARATSRVEINGRRLVVTNTLQSLPKLTEAETTRVVHRRGHNFADVLLHHPAETFISRGIVRDHRDATTTRPPRQMHVPPVSLRAYADAYCVPRQIVIAGNLLVADTYRHHLRSRLITSGTAEVGHRFASVPDDLGAARMVEGSVFQFDSEWSGHYGHLLTEQLARLWAYRTAKERYPELRPILYKKSWTDQIAAWERGLLESAGIPGDDALVIAGAVRPERVLAATPMFCQPQYVSPRIIEIWDEVGRGAERLAGPVRTPERIFLSRRDRTRSCHNLDDVEYEFAAAGFDVVYPESMTFPEQVTAFRNAEVIAGFAGSGVFTSMLCERPARILLLCSEGYNPHNERLITAVRGHEVDIFWSVPDHQRISGPFRFDFQREGRRLRQTLAEIE